jgi:cyclopropane fatty-acyl-phospholipid synthase-like methyltransferase
MRDATEPTKSMKSMKLYHRVDRIHNELRASGIAEGAPLSVADLSPHDQYHYLGTEAVDHAIAALGLGPRSRVLEIGSGIGGPARHVAATVGCRVTALELQPDLNAVAAELTRRCGLADRITHQCGNILENPVEAGGYDAILSLLCFLHIADRANLFIAARRALRPGGKFYIEDLTKRREPSPAQWQDLAVKVQTPYLPTLQQYGEQLETAGFVDVRLEDMTESWTAVTVERIAAFRDNRSRHLAVHGPEIVEGLEEFYDTVGALYADGVLGGARILATKPG